MIPVTHRRQPGWSGWAKQTRPPSSTSRNSTITSTTSCRTPSEGRHRQGWPRRTARSCQASRSTPSGGHAAGCRHRQGGSTCFTRRPAVRSWLQGEGFARRWACSRCSAVLRGMSNQRPSSFPFPPGPPRRSPARQRFPWPSLGLAVLTCVGAAPVSCPSSLSCSGTGHRPVDDASLFDGLPNQEADLVPVSAGAVDRWNLNGADSCLACRFHGTSTVVTIHAVGAAFCEAGGAVRGGGQKGQAASRAPSRQRPRNNRSRRAF